MTWDVPTGFTTYALKAPDHTLIRALTAKVARWEPFETGDGELCFGGFRYSLRMDGYGVPMLYAELREKLREALEAGPQ